MNKDISIHYHVNLLMEDKGIKELLVAQMEKDSWEVIDYWGDITDIAGKTIATFFNGKLAVEFAIKTLKKKFKGKILTGAGCPPDKWIKEFER